MQQRGWSFSEIRFIRSHTKFDILIAFSASRRKCGSSLSDKSLQPTLTVTMIRLRRNEFLQQWRCLASRVSWHDLDQNPSTEADSRWVVKQFKRFIQHETCHEVSKAVNILSMAFWNTKPCSLVGGYYARVSEKWFASVLRWIPGNCGKNLP